MTKDLGVWKAEDCALVLIDYQPLSTEQRVTLDAILQFLSAHLAGAKRVTA